jgi:hypothetical protein
VAWETAWEPSDADRERGLEEAEIIGRLVDDPDAIPEFFIARGWLGRSPQPNHWRVYMNAYLTEFVEVAATDVLAVETADGVSRVWIAGDAEIRSRTRTEEAESAYIDGPILTDLLEDGSPGFGYFGSQERLVAAAPTKCPRCPRKSY